MEQRNLSDAVLINDIAQKLGITPLDIFMNWITTGEIKNITVSIAYKNGDVVKADLMQSVSQPEEKRHVPELSESEEKVPEMETDSLPPSTGKDDEEEKKPNSEIAGTHVGAIKETPVKAEKPTTDEKSTETEKTAKTTAEKKPATRRRGRPKKTQ